MKVKAKKTYENLKDLFVKGDILEFITIKDDNGFYKDFLITTEDGRSYCGSTIRNFIGWKNACELFEKVED